MTLHYGRLIPAAIQIFTPLELERRAVVAALPRDRVDIAVTLIGVRATRLPQSLPPATRLVVLAGLAGGLDPSLRVGDVVVDDADTGFPGALAADLRRGRIVTVEHPLNTPAAKAEAFARGAVAVEMEAAAVCAFAADAGVSFLHIRAISDPADTSLDPRLLSLVDDVGRPRIWPLTGYLLRDPRRIATLRKLGRASSTAATRLGDAVARLIQSIGAVG